MLDDLTSSDPPPAAWPVQHVHDEVQYTPSEQVWSAKHVNYDYPNRALRYDITYIAGPQIPLVTLLNFTSLWLNDTLFSAWRVWCVGVMVVFLLTPSPHSTLAPVYTYATPLDNSPSCIALSMGFGACNYCTAGCELGAHNTHPLPHHPPSGLMRPDWFITDAVQLAIAWVGKKSDALDQTYHRTMMSQKDAGQDEPFTYYAWFENSTVAGTANGSPYLMHAPSPSGMVVNEYYDFVPHEFAPGDPIFAQPATPACIPTREFAHTPADAVRILRAAHPRFEHLAFAEVLLGDKSTLAA